MHFLDSCKLQGFSVLIWNCFVLSCGLVNWWALYSGDQESGASLLTHCELSNSPHGCGEEELPLRLHALPVLLRHRSQPGRYSREWQGEFNKQLRIESPDTEGSVTSLFVSPPLHRPFLVSICDSFDLWQLSPAGWNNPDKDLKIYIIEFCVAAWKPWKEQCLFFRKALSCSVGGDVNILWIFSLENRPGDSLFLAHAQTHHHHALSHKCMNLPSEWPEKLSLYKELPGDW